VSVSHWNALYQAWSRMSSPPRVPAEVLAGLRRRVFELPGHVLVLGVTPDLAHVGSDVTAVDSSMSVVRTVWPGDAPTRRAIVGDWLQLPFAAAAFSVCVGDGTVNALGYPNQLKSLFEGLARVLRVGGEVLCRVFLTPDIGETITAVKMATLRGEIRRFQAFKFRLAMAIVAEAAEPNIRVRVIHDVFEATFGDRNRLAEATGWDRAEIDTIDVYGSSSVAYSFPTREQCLAVVPEVFSNARVVPVGTYELAERCPLLVMERA